MSASDVSEVQWGRQPHGVDCRHGVSRLLKDKKVSFTSPSGFVTRWILK